MAVGFAVLPAAAVHAAVVKVESAALHRLERFQKFQSLSESLICILGLFHRATSITLIARVQSGYIGSIDWMVRIIGQLEDSIMLLQCYFNATNLVVAFNQLWRLAQMTMK